MTFKKFKVINASCECLRVRRLPQPPHLYNFSASVQMRSSRLFGKSIEAGGKPAPNCADASRGKGVGR